jgi:hypothetical protein
LNSDTLPASVDVPVNVTVPADAAREPEIDKLEAMEKLRVVVIVPGMFRAKNAIVPAPAMDVPLPLSV